MFSDGAERRELQDLGFVGDRLVAIAEPHFKLRRGFSREGQALLLQFRKNFVDDLAYGD